MAINKKLIHFNSKENFDNKVANNEILDTSIVFVKDSKEIYTHGNLYKSVNWSVLKPEVALAGDIAYWDGSKVKTVSQENWDVSLGTPVGVVVVPTGFAPDGKARMLSLRWPRKSGTGSTVASKMNWGQNGTDTSITNHNRVPTTDNAGSTTTGSNSAGHLPSDQFTGATSYVDPIAKYYINMSSMIPSPYLGNKPNSAYYAPISGYNNLFADFDGKGNTDVLVALGSDYVAANAARNYKAAGAEEIEWYLPAAGELGYMIARSNKINAALTKVNASQLGDRNYWSSSEYSSNGAYYVGTTLGYVNLGNKTLEYYVRAFAIID